MALAATVRPRRRGDLRVAVVRGVPDPRHAGRRHDGAGPARRPPLRPRRHGRRGHRPHAARVRVQPEQSDRHQRSTAASVERLPRAGAERSASSCSTRPTASSSPRPTFPTGSTCSHDHENVCVLRTFSKAYGLAALRVGYAIAHASVIGALRKVRDAVRGERARAGGRVGVAGARRTRCASASTA